MAEADARKLPPTPIERAPRPELGTRPIPKQRYTSREFARLERERLWPRAWLLAGFERDLPEPGDYLTFEIGAESVLVVRQRSGGVAAHHNVCKHRGNRLCEPGRGNARAFVCGFHGWRYGLDGALEYAQDAETFPQGCPQRELSLTPVRCDTWGGFVWVNLDLDAEPLQRFLDPLPAHLDPYHFDEMRILDDWTVEVACNWKTSLDAFNESYHIAGTHPDSLDVNDDVDVPIDCYERHSRMLLKLAVASPRHPEHGKLTRTIRESFLATAGIDPSTFRGGALDVRPAIAKAVREIQGPALGADFSELRDEQLVDDFHYTVFPNVTLNIFGRSAWLFRHRPHPSDPDRMFFDFFNLLRAPALDVPRPEHEELVLGDDFAREPVGGGGRLLGQDFYNLPRIQRGMHSRGFGGLHLGDQELRIRHFHAVLDRYLGGPGQR
jgi:phenylpropionate dioxygenase-like ring-hydroxylating dioxygenase large terminal subunit